MQFQSSGLASEGGRGWVMKKAEPCAIPERRDGQWKRTQSSDRAMTQSAIAQSDVVESDGETIAQSDVVERRSRVIAG